MNMKASDSSATHTAVLRAGRRICGDCALGDREDDRARHHTPPAIST